MNLVLPAGVTPAALVACVKREIGMRQRVYPGWVARKRMSQGAADAELKTMRAVLAVLEQVVGAPACPETSPQLELVR